MLSKPHRLSRAEFNAFFSTGVRFHQATITGIYTPHQIPKVSVVVGKKVSKKAVTRNTLRRQIYGVVEEYLKENNGSGVYIFITKPPLTLLSRAERAQVVREILARMPRVR